MPVKKTTKPKKDSEDFRSKIGAPARRALENKGIKTVKKLSQFSEKEILALHGVGPSAIPHLKKALKSAGLAFKKQEEKPKKTPAKAGSKEAITYHNNGTVWAKGQIEDGQMHGYWEWFRKDGVILRSGYFEMGKQVGKWTTYDREGQIYKVTEMKK